MRSSPVLNNYQALSTFFRVRRQRAHMLTVLTVPFSETLTLRILGFQALFVLRCEWETELPNTTPLPQTLHFAISDTSSIYSSGLFTYNIRYYSILGAKKQEFF